MSGQNVQRPLDALAKEIVNLEVHLRALIYT